MLLADLSSQSSIHGLASAFRAEHSVLDVLINNAGVIPPQRTVTDDGLETQFAVNYLAGFLLTNLLMEALETSASARVVTITSNAHQSATLDFDDLQCELGYHAQNVYRQTKLANILFTYELARRLQGTQITANCLHPGVIATGLLSAYKGSRGKSGPGFMDRLLHGTPAKGALAPLYLATSAELEGVSGKYFVQKKASESSNISYDSAVAERLWKVSQALTDQKAC